MKLYACHNRGEFAPSIRVADGYENTWARRMVDMQFRMDPRCVYSTSELGQADEKCNGCIHRRTDDLDRTPESPALADGATLDGGVQGPLLEPSAGDSARPGVCEPADPADSGDAEALEAKYPNAQIYRRSE